MTRSDPATQAVVWRPGNAVASVCAEHERAWTA